MLSPANRLDTLPPGTPTLTLGWEAAQWAAKYLRQPNGPTAGQRFELTTRQLRFLLHWYALNPDGSWVYHHGVRRLAKGSGKSPFAAALALMRVLWTGAAGRWIFDDPLNYPGGCVGKRVSDAAGADRRGVRGADQAHHADGPGVRAEELAPGARSRPGSRA